MHRQRSAIEFCSFTLLYQSINVFQDGSTPLYFACSNGQLEIVRILLGIGAMPDIMQKVMKSNENRLIKLIYARLSLSHRMDSPV